MPYLEQLIFGSDVLSESTKRLILGHSPGMGKEASDEIVSLCEGWGSAPPLGLEQPFLMSFPLKATMPALPGQLFGVIRGSKGDNPLFHALILNDEGFSAFGRNPYSVAAALAFHDEWQAGKMLERFEVHPNPNTPLVYPSANPQDVGLVDEAVVQVILKGHLELPIELAVNQSDRALALIIASLPLAVRKKLRFASFATSINNQYTLAAVETDGCTFAGWQRLMMTEVNSGMAEEINEYQKALNGFLQLGDMTGITRLSERHRLPGPGGPKKESSSLSRSMDSTGPGSAAVRPASPAPGPGLQPRQPGGSPVTARRSMVTPGRIAADAPRLGSPPPGVLDTASRTLPPPRSTLKRKKIIGRPQPAARGAKSRILRVGSLLLIVFVAGWVATMLQNGRTLTQSLEWAGIPGMGGDQKSRDLAPTLLEVVNVGKIYDKQLKHVSEGGFVLGPSLDKGREKAMARLSTQAAEPLHHQVDLLAKLAADGILQGSRPDREVERLQALARQSKVLVSELQRLELAWFSLADGVFWRDLGKLTDAQVAARHDSLAADGKKSLEDARQTLGTAETRKKLVQAEKEISGMASLMTLFGAKDWSTKWEKNLRTAASNVSPRSSTITRAYRNSAFALLGLKKAEKDRSSLTLPYAAKMGNGAWPSAEVKKQLVKLRREAGRFTESDAPALIGGTLNLYTELGDPARAVAKAIKDPAYVGKLERNPAYRFDVKSYEDYLGRIRYEAAAKLAASLADSVRLPESLTASMSDWEVREFQAALKSAADQSTWNQMASRVQSPFLIRWSDFLADQAGLQTARVQGEFDAAWIRCRNACVLLQAKVRDGEDWTEQWAATQQQVEATLQRFSLDMGRDDLRASRLEELEQLNRSLDRTVPLGVEGMTVRLEQGRLTEPTMVVAEFSTGPQAPTLRSEPFLVGPAAPAGTGWVGTAVVDWNTRLGAADAVNVRVVLAESAAEILALKYAPLAEGAGVGALTRPRTIEGGSCVFRIDPDFWKGLEVPDLGMIF